MTRESTLEYTAIREQFHELANLINEPITVYLIGGGALTLQELKNATKDIDLIVREEYELKQLWAALTTAGYEPPEDLEQEYDELDAAFILENGKRRFDVFHRQVAGVLMLSDDMEARSQHLFEDGPLTVRMVSLDDIFLFKSVANRDDDVDDMVVLAQAGIDEELIVQEVHTQLSLIGRDEFVGAMKHKLARLKEQGYSFDIQDEIERLHSRTVDGERVAQCIRLLSETEYDDDLYEGVPERTVESRVGEETATSGIKWLQQIGLVRYGEDGSLVLQEKI
ncbi:DUF6036 family nucleotidyltransferase [Haloferax sulfurifontis]|uniref:DUF6036 domain-containing protein n=1 Tax=Haloferax sulfurifontis ATCC BAA-897 TaxID=662480 RepID=M0HX09_9EURY|nr:DUF6036 family nucleotidyltransferase [Haloferax sulfurifontis]ELZ88268.1 hypothetical protein C441_18792 [Haloferax sulfurifontis ATCC BAA-897]